MLKEKIYAWYPQVDVVDYTAVKPDSYEIECLYRQATNQHLEKYRPSDINVPTIGFRISRKTAQEEEKQLSPVEFLRRCKSVPLLQPEPCDELDSRQLTSDARSKPETKTPPAIPNTEQPTNEVSSPKSNQHLQTPTQGSLVVNFDSKSSTRVRPYSASVETGNKPDEKQCIRKILSARINRHSKTQRSVDSPTIVVTPPDGAVGNTDITKASLLKSSIPAPGNILKNSANGVFGSRNRASSFSSRVYRPRITSADGRGRGAKKENPNKSNTKYIDYSSKILGSSNRSIDKQTSEITDPNNFSGRHQIRGVVQNENKNVLQNVAITGKNVVALGKKDKGDNSLENSRIEVRQPSKGDSVKPEVEPSKSACANMADVRKLAIKEIAQYDFDEYERSLRENGWRMELQGNKFGLKKTPIRLPYWVPLVVPKVSERPPVFHTKASSTFFYNTIPSRPKRITVSQNWHSEIGYEQRLANINRKRRGYHYRNWSFVY